MSIADCPHSPKLDPRVRRTRGLLEDALRALMTEKAYDEISVGDIAERATVNRATFYAHFEDKRDLAATLIREDLHAALVAAWPKGAPPEATLQAFAVAVFEFVARTFRACPSKPDDFAPHVGPTLQETLQTFLRHWLDYDPDAMRPFAGSPKDAVASVLAWSLYGSAFRWGHNARRPPADKAAREVVTLLVR